MEQNVYAFSSGLKLKEWLLCHLDQNTFPGLTWHTKQERLFQISWTEQGKPYWEETQKICEAWAQNKDGNNNKQNFSTLKGRFRDALRNSNNVEERKHLSKLTKQTGNYKVFKFLTAAEIKDKKKQRKEGNAITPTTSPESSQDISSDAASNFAADCSDLDSLLNSLDIQNNLLEEPTHDVNPNLLVDVAMSSLNIPAMDVLANETILDSSDNLTHQETSQIILPQVPQYETSLELLKALGFHENELRCYRVSLLYERTVIFEENLDFSNGGRVLYDGWLRNHTGPILFPDVPVLNLPQIAEPNQPNFSSTVIRTLENVAQGVVLHTNPVLDLYGKRLCRMKVYCFNSDFDGKSVTMEQDIPKVLFSYSQYMQKMMEYRQNTGTQKPECEIMISFGKSPSSLISLNTRVSLIIKPVVACKLQEMMNPEGSSILFSNEKSRDASMEFIQEFINESSPPTMMC